MEKKLYRVKIVLFVMAENESDARLAATRARFDIFECAARKAENIDTDWKEAIPYNSDDDRTCSEIMTNRQPTVQPETYSMIVLPQVETGMRVFEMNHQSIRSVGKS